nr:hypothetical transcript [Hymenolepis microstoma]
MDMVFYFPNLWHHGQREGQRYIGIENPKFKSHERIDHSRSSILIVIWYEKVFDHNNDSYIDHDEIKRTMHFLGETVTDDDVRAMIKEADADHDGLVDFEANRTPHFRQEEWIRST